MMRSVLLIDDDELVRETQSEALAALGYDVWLAETPAEGLELVTREPWVILLDQRLDGVSGGDIGLDLIPQLVVLSPTSRILVMTGYASRHSVNEAYDHGVFDYLQKGASFGWLLPHKVRMAADSAGIARARRPNALEPELRSTLAAALAELNAQRKGLLLEHTLQLLFQTMPGLTDARRDVRSTGQQIDVVVFNESNDALLAKQGSVFLVECKNWTSRVGTPEIRALLFKMGTYQRRCQVGIMVAVGGFSDEVLPDLLRGSKEIGLVVRVDGGKLEAWVEAADRVAWLRDAVKDALLE